MRNHLRGHWVVIVLALGLGACSRERTSTAAPIGPAGGTIEAAADGPRVTLSIPPGAVGDPTPFGLRALSGLLPGAAGPAIEATPHGVVFSRPVRLRFSPRKEELAPGVSFAELRVATLKDGRWELLPTTFPAAGAVEGLTSHFSTFALVAPCHVSGTGTDFPLAGCPTFDARVQTSDLATLDVIGGSVTVRIVVSASPTISQVSLTVSRLSAGATYYLLVDGQPAPTRPASCNSSRTPRKLISCC